MNDCVFSSFVSSASSSGIGSYAQAARMGTGLMGASSSAMGGMVAWMNGNQCGDISEVVVTPDKSWVVPVAETTNTILDNIGSSLKNHGGNSTWGSNGHFYWHGSGEQGFYGNQYVSTAKLVNVGKFITKYTSNINKLSNAYKVSRGVVTDFQNYSQYGYTDARNTIQAISDGICSWAGSTACAQIGGLIFVPLGPLGVCVGVAAFGIVGDYIGNNYLSPFIMDKVYGK